MQLLSPNDGLEVKSEHSRVVLPLRGMFIIHSTTAITIIAAVVMVISLTIFALSAVKGSQYYETPHDLLGGYNDIFPGQPASALDHHICKLKQLTMYSNQITKLALCGIYPQSGFFSRILVSIQRDQISELIFYAKGLEPEAIFAYWGSPTLMKRTSSGMSFRLLWENPIYTTTVLVTDSERMVYEITLRLNGSSSPNAGKSGDNGYGYIP